MNLISLPVDTDHLIKMQDDGSFIFDFSKLEACTSLSFTQMMREKMGLNRGTKRKVLKAECEVSGEGELENLRFEILMGRYNPVTYYRFSYYFKDGLCGSEEVYLLEARSALRFYGE